MFQVLTRSGLKLPECKRPLEANMTNEPNYCPYHRILGHKIERGLLGIQRPLGEEAR